MIGIKVFRKIGVAIDRRYLRKAGAIPAPGSDLKLLLICFHPYRGKKPARIDATTIVSPGDPVAELHLSNIQITRIAAETQGRSLEWQLMEMLKTEFACLAAACVNKTIPEAVRGFYGVNVLAAGARRLGFTLIPLPAGWDRWWLGFWESMLRLVYYSYKTKRKAKLQKTMDPYEIWISRETLVAKYYRNIAK